MSIIHKKETDIEWASVLLIKMIVILV